MNINDQNVDSHKTGPKIVLLIVDAVKHIEEQEHPNVLNLDNFVNVTIILQMRQYY